MNRGQISEKNLIQPSLVRWWTEDFDEFSWPHLVSHAYSMSCDGMILDPRLKLYLTKQPQWSGGNEGEYSKAGYSKIIRIEL